MTKLTILLIIAIIVIVFLIYFKLSFGNDFSFDKKDLRIYNKYVVNQQLIFKSNTNLIDTFQIKAKKKFHTTWTPITRDGKYNPPNAVIYYEKTNSNDFKIYNHNKQDFELPALFHFRKRGPDEDLIICFKFQNIYNEIRGSIETLEKESIEVSGQLIDSYIIEYHDGLLKENDIQKIYFDKYFQIIRYQYKGGLIWNRVQVN